MMPRLYPLAGLFLVAGHARANMYDVVLPKYTTTCKSGCLAWSDAIPAANMSNFFAGGASAAASAGTNCAMPANHAGDHECDCGQKSELQYIFDSYSGPWCFCKDPAVVNEAMYCTPPYEYPEQINLQVAAPNVVVVGFVTYEKGNTTSPPVAEITEVGAGDHQHAAKQVSGVTHVYSPPGRDGTLWNNKTGLPYHMHYIRFLVEQHKSYTYKVKSGSALGGWSDEFTFRAPVADGGVTRIATYGDAGHSHYNMMENVLVDGRAGVIDAVVHMGDHCYNLGFDDDRRGDAYMNAWQPALASVPWFPIIGNHEASDGDHFKHYEAIAWGEAYGSTTDAPPFPGALKSTATTALGAHLTHGTFYGMGLHGSVPSNTSRYASSDIGLIHMVGLDLNKLDDAQLAWLEADLIAVNKNRSKTPWIIVMSHFPVWHSKTKENGHMSKAHYVGDEALDYYALDGHNMDFVTCPKEGSSAEGGCPTIAEFQLQLAAQLQPLFKKYGVDFYNAGHVHSYESTWPMCDFSTGELCPGATPNSTQLDFINPKGTFHVTEGNGGVPGVPGTFAMKNCSTPQNPFCRKTASGGAYARVTAWNYTHLTYDHVQNNGGNITDSFTVVQSHHGAFAAMADL